MMNIDHKLGSIGNGISEAHSKRRFKPPHTYVRHIIILLVLVFLGYSISYLNLDLTLFSGMFGRLSDLFANQYYPPDVEYVLQPNYLASVRDTVQMAYLATLFGVFISVPLAWFGAINITPSRRFAYPAARLVVMASRSVHEMIWTILFVFILGFGMFPGVLALTLMCIGFAGKLFSEEAEAIDPGPVEALRSTGANSLQVFIYAVLPQVRTAWTGIAIYCWDVVFRAATVVGFFGAGGTGWYLRRTVQQLQWHRVAAILLFIIVVVIISEILSAWIRERIARAAA